MFLIIPAYILLALFILLYQKPRVFNIMLSAMYISWSICLYLFLVLLSTYLDSFPDLIKLFFLERNIRSYFTVSYDRTVYLYRSLTLARAAFIGSCFFMASVGLKIFTLKRKYWLIIITSAVLIFQIVIQDPSFVVNIIKPWMIAISLNYEEFRAGMAFFVYLNRFIYGSLCILSLVFLFKHYRKLTVRILKNEWLLLIISLLPTIAAYFYTFIFGPFELTDFVFFFFVKPIYTGLTEMQKTPYYIYSVILIVSLMLTIFALFQIGRFQGRQRLMKLTLTRKLGTVNLGIRAFSHNIKNHFLVISRMNRELLKNQELKSIDSAYIELQKMREVIDDSLKSVDILARNTKDLHLIMKPVSLIVPLLKVVEQFKVEAEIEFFNSSEPYLSLLDVDRIEEVLINIFTNSIEAVPHPRKAVIDVKLNYEDRWSILSVEDNGSGFQEDFLDRIFDPFETTKAHINNWGFGLSYSFKIISAHGGKIIAENRSEDGSCRGARITIMLPVLNL